MQDQLYKGGTGELRSETDIAEDDVFIANFERQVTRSPHAAAILFEGETISYDELNRRANRLAHFLVQEGLGREDIVAVALPRTPDFMVAILGILKAGAAYLPLDTAYPEARLAYMLEDSKPCRVILNADCMLFRLGNLPAPLILDLEETVTALAQMPAENPSAQLPANRAMPSNAAYIIYTSGSTGRPKGVVVSHAGLPILAASQIDRFAISNEARVLQFASLSFDASVSEWATTLSAGACLVMASAATLLPGDALAAFVAKENITHVTLPPSALAVMRDDALPTVATLVVAGEPCPPHQVAQWSRGRRMINAYGPTEATVCATMSKALSGAVVPPIGQASGQARVYLLDTELNMVPEGATGELYIAGPGLARGYLGRPDLTAEVFIPDPFGVPGSRMYRTGDLAYKRENGDIEFMGRRDHQIKIRGFRIETGEIETVLLTHPQIKAAAVVAKAFFDDQKILAAYVVPQPGTSVAPDDLKRFLAERLPDYMVPGAMVPLEALPLNSNGKLDRHALPAPDFNSLGSKQASSQTETVLAGLFAEILSLEQVAVDVSFFDLGGHSLTATRLLSRIRSELGVELELDDVFDMPTVAVLAAHIDEISSSNEARGSARTAPTLTKRLSRA